MAKRISSKEYLERAAKIERTIRSGKLKGKALRVAKWQISHFKWKAKKSQPKKLTKIVKRPRKHELVPGQGFLPNFLKQMDMVKIQELVVDRIFQQVKNDLEKLGSEPTTERKSKRKAS